MLQSKNSYRNSLATRLFRIIFGLYFIVAVIITLFQLGTEYYHEKEMVLKEIEKLPSIFGPGLDTSLWTFNHSELQSILKGMCQIPVVVGASILDHNGRVAAVCGTVTPQEDQVITYDNEGVVIKSRNKELLVDLYALQFDIRHADFDGTVHLIGKGSVYTNNEIVFNRVKYGFLLIVVNAILKTFALWIIFFLVIRKTLALPLQKLTGGVKKIQFPMLGSQKLDAQIKERNELKLLEEAFNAMIDNLRENVHSLRKSEERLSMAVEATKIGIFDHNIPFHKDSFLSERWASILGYSTKELPLPEKIYFWFMEKIHPDDAENIEKKYRSLIEGNIGEYDEEFRVRHKGGGWIFVRELIKVVKDSEKESEKKVIGVLIDVSDRKQIEEQLRQLNLMLRSIRGINQLITKEKDEKRLLEQVCHILTGVRGYNSAWIVLSDSLGNYRIAAESGLGEGITSLQEILAQGTLPPCARKAISIRQPIVPESPSNVCQSCSLEKFHQADHCITVGLYYKEVVFGFLTISTSKFISFDREEESLFKELAEDVGFALYNLSLEKERKRSEEKQKKLEKQLQQSQKMEAIGTLAGGIAHDFNNLLFAMLLNIRLVIDLLPEKSELREYLLQSQTAGNRATDLIRQILTFSRQSSQKVRPLDVSLIIKETTKMLHSLLPANINVTTDIQGKIGKVKADPTAIYQIILNLSTNAGYAMRERGGTLSFELEEKNIDLEYAKTHGLKKGENIRLTVSDTGGGMEKEVLEHIFDPYFTTKPVGEGTGMGLSVVHGIIKELGGGISVYSEPGKGTTFNIFLPVIEKETLPEHKEAFLTLPHGSERILLIDDEQLLVDAQKTLLTRIGYRVDAATDSVEALELFRSEPEIFDLVITDQSMPKMTGDQLIQEILAIRPDTAIILSTGFSHTVDEIKAKKLGVKAFLNKPVPTAELAETVRNVLDSARSRGMDEEF